MRAGRVIAKRMGRDRITNSDVARRIGVTPQAVAFWRARLAAGIPLPIGRLDAMKAAVGLPPPPLEAKAE